MANLFTPAGSPVTARSPFIAVRRAIGRAIDWIAAGHETMRQRQALGFLSDERLRDIGLTRADVQREVSRPFWQR